MVTRAKQLRMLAARNQNVSRFGNPPRRASHQPRPQQVKLNVVGFNLMHPIIDPSIHKVTLWVDNIALGKFQLILKKSMSGV